MDKLDTKLKERIESLENHSHPVLITCGEEHSSLLDHLNKNGVVVDDNLIAIQMLVADLTSKQIEELLIHDDVTSIALDDDASVQ